MIEEGARFRHRKFGPGTAKKYYPKSDGVSIVFDSGHKTVCARTRLIPITELTDEQKETVSAPSSDVKVTRSRAAGSAHVDYKLLDKVKKHFEKLFPEADRVAPKIYGARYYAEIWKDKAARIVFYESGREV